VSVVAKAVITMLMMFGSISFASRSTSTPVISGMRMSVINTSTCSRFRISIAALPLSAISTR
jgi:hypothetical protein